MDIWTKTNNHIKGEWLQYEALHYNYYVRFVLT